MASVKARLAGPLSNQLTVTATSSVVKQGPPPAGTGAPGFVVGLPASGIVEGSFAFPVTNAVTAFKGVAFQKTTRAAGFFLAPVAGAIQESGAVTIVSQP